MNDSTAIFSVSHRFSFEAAHQLPGHPTCGTVHGHSYAGKIRVRSGALSSQGFVIDFEELKAVTARYDHGDVLTKSAERLAEEIGRSVLAHLQAQDNYEAILSVSVILNETRDGAAKWRWQRSG